MVHAARLAGIAIERRRGEEALRASEAKFRRLYERVLEGVYQCAPDGRVLEVNPAFVKMLGYGSAEEIYALPGIAMLYRNPAERAEFERALERHGEIHNAEFVLRCRDGSQVVVLESARVVRDDERRIVAYEGTIANITARKRAEQAMFAEKERAQVTLQSIGDAVITTDREGRIDYMNPVAEQLSGWRSEEARGEKLGTVLRLLDQLTHRELENPLVRCLREGQLVHFAEHSVLQNRLGQEIEIEDSAAPIRDRNGEIVGAVVVFRDVTKERRLKRALSYQASHDALTGLINRREFDNRLARCAAERAGRPGPACAAVRRPGPVQGGQRYLRSFGRRPAAARRHRPAAGARAQRRYHRAAGRRRIRHPGAALHRRAGRAHRREHPPGDPRLSLHLGADHQQHRRQHRRGGDHRARPTASPACSVRPTSPATPPRIPAATACISTIPTRSRAGIARCTGSAA